MVTLWNPASDSFIRYLSAKKSVDDRALNRRVWETLSANLPATETLRVLEVGAGIGTMLERMIAWGLLRRASYTAIDSQEENIAHARRRLPTWAVEQGIGVQEKGGDLLLCGGEL